MLLASDRVRFDWRAMKWWHVVVPSMREQARKAGKRPGRRKRK
jgi:hypothetical protein